MPDVIVRVPKFPKRLPEKNVRQGFFEQADIDALLPYLPPMVQDLVRLAFRCGWRRGELFGLPPATSNTRMVRASVGFEALR